MRPGGCDVSHVSRAPAPDPALAVVLKRLREDRGLTQEALAFKSGVSISSLGRIETVRQLAAALGVSMGELGSMVDVER
jgi:hypothetical protein